MLPRPSALPCLTAALLAASPLYPSLVINELHYNPPGSGDATEFIELFNTNSSPVDLSGWRMTDGVTFTFPAGASVPAHGFLVLAKNNAAFAAAYPHVTNVYGPYDPTSLANEGERVALSDSAGTLITDLTYDDAPPWPTTPDGDGPSLELINPSLNPNDPASWAASYAYGGSPGATNSVFISDTLAFTVLREPRSPPSSSNVILYAYFTSGSPSNLTAYFSTPYGWTSAAFFVTGPNCWSCTLPPQPDGSWVFYLVRATTSNNLSFSFPPRATNLYRVLDQPFRPRDLIINEIMYASAVEAHPTPYEYVELLNTSSRTLDLAGCTFEEFRLPTNTFLLPPGSFAVIADKPDVLSNVYGPLPRVLPLNIGLSDNGESLRLLCPNDTPLCEFTYDDEPPWPSLPRSFGPSLELLHPAAPLNSPSSWAASSAFGSPGLPNTALTNHPVVSLSSITTLPTPPPPNQPFSILAHIPASTTILAVTLYYRTNALITFSTPMHDDGLHHDCLPSDGIFGAMIPPLPPNRTLWFYLRILLPNFQELIIPPPSPSYPASPQLTVRLSNGGLATTVTPLPTWQRSSSLGQATSSRLYLYAENAGQLLIDDVSITYDSQQHVTNGTFTHSIAGWVKVGNHADSYFDPTDGYSATGCLHLVAAGTGTGASQHHVRQDLTPPLLQDGRLYNLSFAYRAVPQPPLTNWFWLRIASNGPRTVCISEINYHPMHDGLGNFEFVELYNYGPAPVDLTQWSL
ncbi:MAG: lamin tail domain-containing protein, partial [bacterium]|nr:lamin tail domain-containing protein [bacterium]